MIIEKLKPLKRSRELVAFKARLDDTLPKNPDKLYRDLDGRMFFIKHIFLFAEPSQCQDPVLLIVGDVDKYLHEGDDVAIVGQHQSEFNHHQDDFYNWHDIPGGGWRGVGGRPHKCSGVCGICGSLCGKVR